MRDPFAGPPANLLQPPPNIPPALEPMATDRSETADDYEAELQEAFNAVFEAAIRPGLERIQHYGTPHRGDIEVLERLVKAHGLGMDRTTVEEANMRELLRAWVARNPKRGLHFLRLYLRLVYPGISSIAQLWMDPRRRYPGAASANASPSSWLTSRVRVQVDAAAGLSAEELTRARAVMQSVVPARIVLEVAIDLGDVVPMDVGIAGAVGAEGVFNWVCVV